MKRVALLSLPRAGSTIICSFFNSLPGSLFISEIHGAHEKREFDTRYGPYLHDPGQDILGGLENFAMSNRLALCGFKEVYNAYSKPVEIMDMYAGRIDQHIFIFRDPRKQWASIVFRGTASPSEIDKGIYARMTLAYAELCESREDCTGFVYESFVDSPEAYTRRITGLDIPATVTLEKFVGGGDQRAMASVKIRKEKRKPLLNAGLDTATSAYNRMVDQYG